MGGYDVLRRLQAAKGFRSRSSTATTTRSPSSSSATAGSSRSRSALARGELDAPQARHPGAPDEHDREDPRPRHMRGEGRRADERLRQAGRRDRGGGRRRLLARVHHGAGALLSRAGVRAGLRDQEPPEVRRLRGSPHLRRRRAEDARLHGQDRDAAALQREFQRTPECATSRPRTASRPASATRSRASSSSTRATSSRPPTATPAWAG
jgi:hypothetical protein